eukprot:COSAG01_NODE_6172_length_3811_cov_11.543912_4_plen_81_part_00
MLEAFAWRGGGRSGSTIDLVDNRSRSVLSTIMIIRTDGLPMHSGAGLQSSGVVGGEWAWADRAADRLCGRLYLLLANSGM